MVLARSRQAWLRIPQSARLLVLRSLGLAVEGDGIAYIDGNMAHHSRVIWQADVFGIMTSSIGIRSVGGYMFLINNERSFYIDLHRAWVRDGAVNLGGICLRPEGFEGCCRCMSKLGGAGFACLRGVRRHGELLDLASVPGVERTREASIGMWQSLKSGNSGTSSRAESLLERDDDRKIKLLCPYG